MDGLYNISLYELVLKVLKENGFDGLSNVLEPCEMDCCCDLDNLGCWCDRATIMHCFPGKKVVVNNDSWGIFPCRFKQESK